MKEKKDTIDMDVFRKAGKKGGTTTAKRGKEYYIKIGKLGAGKRWDKRDDNSDTTLEVDQNSVGK